MVGAALANEHVGVFFLAPLLIPAATAAAKAMRQAKRDRRKAYEAARKARREAEKMAAKAATATKAATPAKAGTPTNATPAVKAAGLWRGTMRRGNPMSDPAFNANPTFMGAPTGMQNPKRPAAVGAMRQPQQARGGQPRGGMPPQQQQQPHGKGRKARRAADPVDEAVDQLVKLHNRLIDITEQIEEIEDFLEDQGVDVDELYDSLEVEDPSEG